MKGIEYIPWSPTLEPAGNISKEVVDAILLRLALTPPPPAPPAPPPTMSSDPDKMTETPLQAVLLCDSFTLSFRPASYDTPKVLCPLNNVPMIDYTIEWLAKCDVKEVIVFAVNQADQIEKHLKASHWGETIKITTIKDSNCGNPGDALREIDKLGLIRSDPFICVSGDVISNVPIAAAIADHKVRKKADAANMMTILLKPTTTGSGPSVLRTGSEDLVVGLNEDTGQIILFEDDITKNKVDLPSSFFDSHSKIAVRTDLLDTGIDICSPDVLARFSDEFDYRDIRKQFVHNSCAEEEEGLQVRRGVGGGGVERKRKARVKRKRKTRVERKRQDTSRAEAQDTSRAQAAGHE